ncbi:uncharacterized protein F4822DRAFT_446123 [Hypoxylon trugodes]|uniref:uncharacterized protein n=1 Tax=Hypoxylon trugodes TaxID=326681 RepID=UPI00219898A3|nr:uncharacterized protein F4822DRAFT_446123 [Hypoxylon trugodes]KAI1385034.1 hypothetical protein F4822DRAFT_446123 [Hypoxylon trugodes]
MATWGPGLLQSDDDYEIAEHLSRLAGVNLLCPHDHEDYPKIVKKLNDGGISDLFQRIMSSDFKPDRSYHKRERVPIILGMLAMCLGVIIENSHLAQLGVLRPWLPIVEQQVQLVTALDEYKNNGTPWQSGSKNREETMRAKEVGPSKYDLGDEFWGNGLGRSLDEDWTSKMLSKVCFNCGEKGNLEHCGKCRIVQYCSRQCQRMDWPIHKRVCTPRPSVRTCPVPKPKKQVEPEVNRGEDDGDDMEDTGGHKDEVNEASEGNDTSDSSVNEEIEDDAEEEYDESFEINEDDASQYYEYDEDDEDDYDGRGYDEEGYNQDNYDEEDYDEEEYEGEDGPQDQDEAEVGCPTCKYGYDEAEDGPNQGQYDEDEDEDEGEGEGEGEEEEEEEEEGSNDGDGGDEVDDEEGDYENEDEDEDEDEDVDHYADEDDEAIFEGNYNGFYEYVNSSSNPDEGEGYDLDNDNGHEASGSENEDRPEPSTG